MQKNFCVLVLLCSALYNISCNAKKVEKKLTVAMALSEPVETAQPDEAEQISFAAYHNLFNQLSTQRYRVNAGKVSVVTADKGLKITVEPGKLEKENGAAPGEEDIQVDIIELTNAEELFKANASTTSNGRLLASGGCYYIGMTSGNSRLRVKKGEALQVEFPVLKQAEMELFYTERDSSGNMNWQRAGVALEAAATREVSLEFKETVYDDPPPMRGLMVNDSGEAIVYRTLDRKVFLQDRMMTVQQLIDTVNSTGIKIIVDTVRPWPKFSAAELARGRVDTNYLLKVFGPEKQFILKTTAQLQKEKAGKEKAEQLKKEAIEKWEPRSLAGALQKYYSPAPITRLGWINCDRFYGAPQEETLELELPITFNGTKVQYFLLYPSINACTNGEAMVSKEGKFLVGKQPSGTSLTVVAFTKMNGEIYHCKKTIVTGREKQLSLKPEVIATAAFNKMFGRNVKTG